MYIYNYIYIYIYIYFFFKGTIIGKSSISEVRQHKQSKVHTCIYMYVHVHTCIYMCIHVHTCAYVYVSTQYTGISWFQETFIYHGLYYV